MDGMYILSKDHLRSFLRKINKANRLVAPIVNRHGDTLFSVIDDLDYAPYEFNQQSQNGIKSFFFPQQETIATYSSQDGDYSFTAPSDEPEPTVYFGVRSCDLMAIMHMDDVFMGEIKDQQYMAKRQQAILIGLNCNHPFENCFCNATKSGPFLGSGFDLQFTDQGDNYLVQVGREKGAALLKQWNQFFTPASEEQIQNQYQLSLEAMANFQLNVHADQAIQRLQNGQVPEEIWQSLSLRCQDCGGCAFICPTCTCFTIVDRKLSADHGIRLRNWDACTFSGFTRMAGGHNPVHHKTQSIKQRFMHKLCHDVKEHGSPSCVGCGRCVDICFGGVDIVRFIKMAGED